MEANEVKEIFGAVASVEIKGDNYPFTADFPADTNQGGIARVLLGLKRTPLLRGEFQPGLADFFANTQQASVQVYDNVTLNRDADGLHIVLAQ